jgi:hypothetical protein
MGLDDCLQISRLNKMFNHFMFKANEVSEFIWRHQYDYEFKQREYPDHTIGEGETQFLYFKRSFALYQTMRGIFREIVNET